MVNRAMKINFRGPRSPWQALLAPMLLASIGLHALILMLPAGSSDEAVIPPPDPEQDTVAITRVPPAGTPDAAASPVVTTTPGVAVAPGTRVAPVAPAARVAPAPVVAPRRAAIPPRSQPQPRPQPTPPQSQTQNPPANRSTTAAATPPPDTSSRPLFDADLGERLLAYVVTLDLPQNQIDQAAEYIQNRFGFRPQAVTRGTLNANQSQWEDAIQQETGLAELVPEIDRTKFSTVYPQRVCLSDNPGEIKVGALVNPDGSWRGEPTLLRSSGYGALDRKALREIQRHEFGPADAAKAYILTVETSVDYGPRPCIDPNPDS